MEAQKLTLDNIGRGKLASMVDREIRKVCENIADPAVATEGSRTITAKIKIKPSRKGETAQIVYSVNSTLLPVDSDSETVYIGMGPDNELALWVMDLRQGNLPLDAPKTETPAEVRSDPTIMEIKPVGTPVTGEVKKATYAPPMQMS